MKVEALPEGSVVHAGCPVLQITAEEPYAHLCTFMETILTHVWCARAPARPRPRSAVPRRPAPAQMCVCVAAGVRGSSAARSAARGRPPLSPPRGWAPLSLPQVSDLRCDAQPPRQGAREAAGSLRSPLRGVSTTIHPCVWSQPPLKRVMGKQTSERAEPHILILSRAGRDRGGF